MKLKYGPCLWNKHAKHNFPEWTKPNTEIEAIDENTIKIDGQMYEFPANGIACPNIYQQTGGVIEEAHRDESGVLCLTVRRFFTVPGAEVAWYSEDYVEVKSTYGKRGSNVQQIKMLTQDDIDTEAEKKRNSEREAEILAELDEIDKKKIRPLSALAIEKASKEDIVRLSGLDSQAEKLRKELREL